MAFFTGESSPLGGHVRRWRRGRFNRRSWQPHNRRRADAQLALQMYSAAVMLGDPDARTTPGTPHASPSTLRTTMTCAQTVPHAAVTYYFNAPHDSFPQTPSPPLHVAQTESLLDTHSRSPSNTTPFDTATVLPAITADTFFHHDPQSRTPRLAESPHKAQPTPSIDAFYRVRTTTVRPAQESVARAVVA